MEDVKSTDSRPTAARARSKGPQRASGVRTPAQAAADIDRVLELYCNEIISKGYDDPEYWWWPRSAWVDPNQLIVDGENGSLYRVGFTTNADQEVTFAAPVEVLETFTDIPAATKARVLVTAAAERQSPAPVRVFASRSELAPLANSDSEGGVTPPGNNVGMNRDQLCEALGLPTTATDAEIDAATAARKAELEANPAPADPADPANPAPPADPADPAPADPAPAPADPAPADPADPAPAAGGPRPGMVEVPAETWAEVQNGAAAGARVAGEAEITRRDDTIASACGAGKIAPSAKESMENLHERDPKAFYSLLTASVADGGLAPNIVPVTRQGGAGAHDAEASATVSDAEMAALFPEVAIPAAGGR
jgi:hypothetical protein